MNDRPTSPEVDPDDTLALLAELLGTTAGEEFVKELTEAIEQWVAGQAAEINNSEPFVRAASGDRLGRALRHFVAAVDALCSGEPPCEWTTSQSLAAAIVDWQDPVD